MLVTWKVLFLCVLHVSTQFVIREITLVGITTYLITRIFKSWKAVELLAVETNFPEFEFLLESLNSIPGSKSSLLLPLERQAPFMYFEDCLPTTQV